MTRQCANTSCSRFVKASEKFCARCRADRVTAILGCDEWGQKVDRLVEGTGRTVDVPRRSLGTAIVHPDGTGELHLPAVAEPPPSQQPERRRWRLFGRRTR